MIRLMQKERPKSPRNSGFRKPGHLDHFGHFLANRPFWPFWPPISEAGRTSRKKVPLRIRLRSTRRSQIRVSAHGTPHRGENPKLRRGCPSPTKAALHEKSTDTAPSRPSALLALMVGRNWWLRVYYQWRLLFSASLLGVTSWIHHRLAARVDRRPRALPRLRRRLLTRPQWPISTLLSRCARAAQATAPCAAALGVRRATRAAARRGSHWSSR